jgi:hypothetical protein
VRPLPGPLPFCCPTPATACRDPPPPWTPFLILPAPPLPPPFPHSTPHAGRSTQLLSALVVHELNSLVDDMSYEELYEAFGGDGRHSAPAGLGWAGRLVLCQAGWRCWRCCDRPHRLTRLCPGGAPPCCRSPAAWGPGRGPDCSAALHSPHSRGHRGPAQQRLLCVPGRLRAWGDSQARASSAAPCCPCPAPPHILARWVPGCTCCRRLTKCPTWCCLPGRSACRVLPGCGHAFHAACLDTWLLEKAMCPVCRAEIKPPAAGTLDPAAAAAADGSGSADALAAVSGPL